MCDDSVSMSLNQTFVLVVESIKQKTWLEGSSDTKNSITSP